MSPVWAQVCDGMDAMPARVLRGPIDQAAYTSDVSRHDGLGGLAPGRLANVAATAMVDFTMNDGAVLRHPSRAQYRKGPQV